MEIIQLKAPDVKHALAQQVAAAVNAMRGMGLYKPPGVAETIDWATALGKLGETRLDEKTIAATLGAVLKYREDQERVAAQGIEMIMAAVADG